MSINALLFHFSPSGTPTVITRVPAVDKRSFDYSLFANGGTWDDLAFDRYNERTEGGSSIYPGDALNGSYGEHQMPISFTKAYNEPPTVLVWLTGVELIAGHPWRVKTFPTNISARGFDLRIESPRTSKFLNVGVSWVVVPSNCKSIITGDLPTSGADGWKVNVEQAPRLLVHETIQKPVSGGSPAILSAILVNAIEVSKIEDLSLSMTISAAQDSQFKWILAGNKSNLLTIGASYIRIR